MVTTGYVLLPILSGAASIVFLIGLWAGFSRVFWFWRAAAVVGAVAVLVPIRAYEPIIVFSFGVPPVWLWAWRKSRRMSHPPTDSSESASMPTRFRFSILDGLLLTLIIGSWFGIIVRVIHSGTVPSWAAAISCALAASAASITACSIAINRGSRRWLAVIVTLGVILAAAAIHIRFAPNWIVVDYLFEISLPPTLLALWMAFYLLLAMNILLVTTLVCFAFGSHVPGRSTPIAPGLRTFAKIMLIVTGILVIAPLSFVYWHMLIGPPIPVDTYSGTNSFPRVMATASEIRRLNPSENLLNRLHAVNSPIAKRMEQAYEEILSDTRQQGFVDMDEISAESEFDLNEEILVGIQALKSLCRLLDAEAQAAADAGDLDQAIRHSMSGVLVADQLCHGGLIHHALPGMSYEGIGMANLCRVRDKIPIDDVNPLVQQLAAIDARREPIELTVARSIAWEHSTDLWMSRLRYAAGKLLAGEYVPHGALLLGEFEKRRDAMHRLVMTDLALRVYQQEQHELPSSLDHLVPTFLPIVPTDPYDGRPLRYRARGHEYQLYSVGPDGQDNGGQFGSWKTVNRNSGGYDLDLDVGTRSGV